MDANAPKVFTFNTQINNKHHILAQYLGAAQRQPTKRDIRPLETFDFCKNTVEQHCRTNPGMSEGNVSVITLMFVSEPGVAVIISRRTIFLWLYRDGRFEVMMLRATGASATEKCREQAGRWIAGTVAAGRWRDWRTRDVACVWLSDRTGALRCCFYSTTDFSNASRE